MFLFAAALFLAFLPITASYGAALSDEDFLELCGSGTPEDIELAIQDGANVMAVNDDTESALHIAAIYNENSGVVTALITNGADVNAATQYEWTALHFAARFNSNLEVVVELLEKGANINARNIEGDTPLIMAMAVGRPECIMLLLDKGADANIKNNQWMAAADIRHFRKPNGVDSIQWETAITRLNKLSRRDLDPKARVDPYQRVYDYADIFTDTDFARPYAPEAELRRIAQEYSKQLGVHFVILTIDDPSVTKLEAFCDAFYLANIAGVDSISDCAFMQINMNTRKVANGFYGDLRSMISQRESDVLVDGYREYMTERDYEKAARYFLDETAKLVERKLKGYHVETPAVDPNKLIYDFAGVLSDEEYSKLYKTTRDILDKTGVGYVVAILGESADEEYLKKYARSFYMQNFQNAGLYSGGVFMLTISAPALEAYAVSYGAYMPKNEELWEMNLSVQSRLRLRSVFAGCEYFLGLEVVDPTAFIYDMSGLLTKDEFSKLADEARDVSLRSDMAHIVIILQDAVEEEKLSWFAASFYRKNIEGRGNQFNGALILAVSAVNKKASVTPLGAYPTDGYSYGLWSLTYDVNSRLGSSTVFSACRYFLYQQADTWRAKLLETPNLDPVNNVHDFAGVLSEEQIANLRALIREIYEKHGVDIQIVCSDMEGASTMSAFNYKLLKIFDGYAREHAGNNYVILCIGSPPGIDGESQYMKVEYSYFGDKTRRKIGSRSYIIEDIARNALGNDKDYYGVCLAFVNETAKAMNSLIPNVRMADEIEWVLQISLLAALALPLAAALVMRINHGKGMKRKVSARNYLVYDSVKLHYSRDIFLHSHTTQSAKEQDSDSDSSSGGGSGSSGDGISTRSERDF